MLQNQETFSSSAGRRALDKFTIYGSQKGEEGERSKVEPWERNTMAVPGEAGASPPASVGWGQVCEVWLEGPILGPQTIQDYERQKQITETPER